MKPRKVTERVQLMGTVDWTRTLFDSLIPLPHGTSYNAYLVRGSEKTALLDSTDEGKEDGLLAQLESIPQVDYVIAHHAEQDHSGALPHVLKRFPKAQLITSVKGKGMLMDLLDLPEERIRTVEDAETLSLGDRTLEFIYTPWVHWPETMCTYLREEQILFSCDFFGSHLATSQVFASQVEDILSSAKRYYAEIMMPFHNTITKNLEKLTPYTFRMIAPSHGPIYDKPEVILEAYKEWVNGDPRNLVVVPYISMHHSTEKLVNRLLEALVAKGVAVKVFDLTITDIGELAMALVDAGTIVVGTPVVLGGPHPLVGYAVSLANVLKPKARFAAFLVSFGWGGAAVERFPDLVPGLKAELLPGVVVRGLPRRAELEAVDALAETIAARHAGLGLR